MLQNKVIKGNILLKSGLHVGGSEAGVKIGGIDSPVIRDPLTSDPYLPGSTLKGKMRFLLEHKFNKVMPEDKGKVPGLVVGNKMNEIAVLFGHLDHNKIIGQSADDLPTRIIVRDAHLVGAYKDFMADIIDLNNIIPAPQAKLALNSNFSESKTEVAIDRLSGTVARSGPRTMERVPAGTVFEFEIILRLFQESDRQFLDILRLGLQLLENDALGGFGSRGSGRIKLFNISVDGEQKTLQQPWK